MWIVWILLLNEYHSVVVMVQLRIDVMRVRGALCAALQILNVHITLLVKGYT